MTNQELKLLATQRLQMIRKNGPAAIAMIAIVMILYFASFTIAPGWVTFTLSFLALMVIAVTALARLDDITGEQSSKRWQVRRAGLILVGASAVGLGFEPLTSYLSGRPMADFPSWKEVAMRWGVALTWVTTPHMPPWWRYITGKYKTVEDARKAEAAPTVSGLYDTKEHPAFVSSEMADAVEAMKETRVASPRTESERRSGRERRVNWPPRRYR